ncbi:Transcription factor Maf [Oopsacas minuta]|uniref:Transcription factor Maf n=1 Tax=Oopsacas minuta TaxID=111878 RepID=A0AAV7JV09_9METZ|nr:Transcription factor Maf [Oopsacas minuta]
MASRYYDEYDDMFTDEEIKNMDIKELNKRIEISNVSSGYVKELKSMRRKMKRQQYGKDSRRKVKESMHGLVDQKNRLRTEYDSLRREVEELEETKAKLECYNMLIEMECRWNYYYE